MNYIFILFWGLTCAFTLVIAWNHIFSHILTISINFLSKTKWRFHWRLLLLLNRSIPQSNTIALNATIDRSSSRTTIRHSRMSKSSHRSHLGDATNAFDLRYYLEQPRHSRCACILLERPSVFNRLFGAQPNLRSISTISE